MAEFGTADKEIWDKSTGEGIRERKGRYVERTGGGRERNREGREGRGGGGREAR